MRNYVLSYCDIRIFNIANSSHSFGAFSVCQEPYSFNLYNLMGADTFPPMSQVRKPRLRVMISPWSHRSQSRVVLSSPEPEPACEQLRGKSPNTVLIQRHILNEWPF